MAWRQRDIALLQGAIVTVTDLADKESLTDSIALLADVPIAKFSFGEHRPQDFIEADTIVVNPAVKPGNTFVEMAAGGRRGHFRDGAVFE